MARNSKDTTAVKEGQFAIYGSGDKGTLELRAMFTEMEIPYRFVDIRKAGDRGGDPLRFLCERNLTTVPQVFTSDGQLIGDFQTTVKYFRTLHK